MTITARDLGLPEPAGGWPDWVFRAPYSGSAHPLAPPRPLEAGANCQRYAFAVLTLFGCHVEPQRSSELWAAQLPHPADPDVFDLVLVNATPTAWGAHVAVMTSRGLLHLCGEVGAPAVWSRGDFSQRPRYAHLVGVVRPPGP